MLWWSVTVDYRNPAASYPKREIYTRRYNIFHLAPALLHDHNISAQASPN